MPTRIPELFGNPRSQFFSMILSSSWRNWWDNNHFYLGVVCARLDGALSPAAVPRSFVEAKLPTSEDTSAIPRPLVGFVPLFTITDGDSHSQYATNCMWLNTRYLPTAITMKWEKIRNNKRQNLQTTNTLHAITRKNKVVVREMQLKMKEWESIPTPLLIYWVVIGRVNI